MPPNPHRVDDPPLPEAVQAEFFERVLSAALEAEHASDAHVVTLALAGTRVQLRFAGRAVVDAFLPALAHLVDTDATEPDVTLHIWDSTSTGVEMPLPPVPSSCFSNRGDIWGMTSPRYRSAFHWVESSVSVLDHERGVGVYWVPSLAGLPFWAMASPFRTLLHWWLASTGAHLMHGAAFGDETGALLITGKGGVGKSTTALTALVHGMQYVSDDYLAVRLSPEPRVYSLYCTAKLDGAQLRQFPALREYVSNRGFAPTDKAVVHLLPHFADRVARSLPLRMLATPEFADQPHTTFASASRIALQRAATYTTMSQLPHAGADLHAFMHRLVHAVPGFTLQLGSDLSRIPSAIHTQLGLPDDALAALSEVPRHDHHPLVSVIVPVYNGAHFLHDAVASVLAQEYPHIEIIVVNDGSTDDLAHAVSTLPVEVRLLTQENAGPAAARNCGLRDAGGDFVAFLDVDDLWPAENLSHFVRALVTSPQTLVVHGRAQIMKRDAHGVDAFVGDPSDSFPYYVGAGLYRREVFARVGLFDITLRFGEDEDWFRRAKERDVVVHSVDEVALFVRRHDGNMTRGKSLVELNTLRVAKLALDRRRAAQRESTR